MAFFKGASCSSIRLSICDCERDFSLSGGASSLLSPRLLLFVLLLLVLGSSSR